MPVFTHVMGICNNIIYLRDFFISNLPYNSWAILSEGLHTGWAIMPHFKVLILANCRCPNDKMELLSDVCMQTVDCVCCSKRQSDECKEGWVSDCFVLHTGLKIKTLHIQVFKSACHLL